MREEVEDQLSANLEAGCEILQQIHIKLLTEAGVSEPYLTDEQIIEAGSLPSVGQLQVSLTHTIEETARMVEASKILGIEVDPHYYLEAPFADGEDDDPEDDEFDDDEPSEEDSED